jgi:predicted Ser/Thr protein kinase
MDPIDPLRASERSPELGSTPPSREVLTEAVFHEALAMPHQSRESFLTLRLPGDSGLRRTVRELLAQHDQADSEGGFLFAVPPPVPSAAGVLAGPEITSTNARYRLLELLGEGGMAVVFLAEQLVPVRRRVALKIVKKGSQSPADLARFSSEIQALALMNHPNIARVYEADTTVDGRLCFAMEYVSGRRLLDYCDDSRVSVRERLELFVAVCRAVQHAHQNGIIHRDIKPSNVLVQTRRNDTHHQADRFRPRKIRQSTAERRIDRHRKGPPDREPRVHEPRAGSTRPIRRRHAQRHLLAGRGAPRARDRGAARARPARKRRPARGIGTHLEG